MGTKRSRDVEAVPEEAKGPVEPAGKKKKGFTVGPANLPDGTYRRKTQKIKADLIQKAKVKKAYAKIKAQEPPEAPSRSNDTAIENERGEKKEEDSKEQNEPAGLEPHPQRQALLTESSTERAPKPEPAQNTDGPRRRERRLKPSAFSKELEIAEKRKQEAEARHEQREFRRKDRDAMAKARRPDQHGKRRLGRESKVLLGRVQRMVGPA
ncbi:hypothetical protein PHISP_03405 [Aspergillus sp. HF37]|nr:hypothetical protein PHISP_03405 [Aspergillus sp. HF37]